MAHIATFGNINVLGSETLIILLIILNVLLTTYPKHKGVHFLLDVLMAHLAAILIGGAQEHVQKCPSFPRALVIFTVLFSIGHVLSSFMDYLKINTLRDAVPSRFFGIISCILHDRASNEGRDFERFHDSLCM